MTTPANIRDEIITLLDDGLVHSESEITSLFPPNWATGIRIVLDEMTTRREVVVVGEDGYLTSQ